jgi:hypothetical protein
MLRRSPAAHGIAYGSMHTAQLRVARILDTNEPVGAYWRAWHIPFCVEMSRIAIV